MSGENTNIIPSFEVELGGETRTLQFGFRALKALGLNPFQPATLSSFLGDDLTNFDIDRAASWVRAGLLWEYAKKKPRFGQEPPTIEDIIDDLDLQKFLSIFDLSLNSSGLAGKPLDGDVPAAPAADPPQA